jgi:hypothetical protein
MSVQGVRRDKAALSSGLVQSAYSAPSGVPMARHLDYGRNRALPSGSGVETVTGQRV